MEQPDANNTEDGNPTSSTNRLAIVIVLAYSSPPLVNQRSHQSGPSGLVGGAQTRPRYRRDRTRKTG